MKNTRALVTGCRSVRYVLDDYDKAIARAKAEKQRMSVPHVIQWNSTEIQEFEFTKNINVEI